MSSEILNPILTEWFQKAKDYGQKFDGWAQIEIGSEQHKAWLMYFHDIGTPPPITLRNIEQNKARTWTAPCEWPHDQTFTVDSKPPPKRPELTFEQKAARCAAILRALGRNIRDSEARFGLVKYSVDIRRRAMGMLKHDERPCLVPMEYRDKKGRVLSSGEPFFLPKWDAQLPPGGPGGVLSWSDDLEGYE